MKWKLSIFVSLAVAGSCMAKDRARTDWTAQSQPSKESRLEGVKNEVYKRVGNTGLKIYIIEPENHKATDKRPAIVFFFGGGWKRGSADQFVPQARYFASRGMVAMTVDYRVYTRQQARIVDCVADAQSAIRWVRANARRLGIDPDRIVASGGSAGGHLAAATGTVDDFTGPEEDHAISARPNAMVLFNPGLDVASFDAIHPGNTKTPGIYFGVPLGADPRKLSPLFQVKPGAPQTIVFHGKADTGTPYAKSEAFVKAMKEAGNRCELFGFEGAPHGFFNWGAFDNKYFVETLRDTDEFLIALKYLSGKPTIDQFIKPKTATRPG